MAARLTEQERKELHKHLRRPSNRLDFLWYLGASLRSMAVLALLCLVGCLTTDTPCGLAPSWPTVHTARSIEGGVRVSVTTAEFQAMQQYHVDISTWIYSCGLQYEPSNTQWGIRP